MNYQWLPRTSEGSLRSSIPLGRRDTPWLAVALLTGVAVGVLYVALNDYPAFGAGLYTATADQIRATGYGLPRTIPHYTADGVPFAYPPLAFYGLAVLRDLGAPMFAAARFVPPVFVVLALVPAYLLGRDLLGGRLRGGAAATLLAVNPQVLQWHVSAGGVVRAPAFLLALAGAYAGLKVFRDRDPAWAPVGLALFALVLLTHPTYALFVVVTDVVFWAGYDRTLRGLGRGAVVGLGGVIVAAPWWLTVAARHGYDVFAGAAGTHGGIGGGLFAVLSGTSIWTVAVLVAGAVAFVGYWRVLAAWLVAAELLFKQPRFAHTVGAFAVVAAVVVVADAAGKFYPVLRDRRRELAIASLLLLATGGLGVVGYEFVGTTSGTTPSFVDDDDRSAMAWAEQETRPGASFVVLGDAAEWFPAATNRTILVGPWGMEWRGSATYERHLDTYRNASKCQSARCIERATTDLGSSPDYLYVPRGHYTVRGHHHADFGTVHRSLAAHDRYEPVFENDGVTIYRVDASTETDG